LLLLGLIGGACGGAKSAPSAASAPQPPTVFSDAPPYASAPIARTAAAAHAAKGVPAPDNKAACLSCHKAGGKAAAFTFAGTIYETDAATKGASDVEVRVKDAKGGSFAAHSDADGNFWLAGSALGPSVHAGARTSAKTSVMGVDITGGDCNDCHDAKLPIVTK
jgi:hypothetical protein